MNCEYINQNFKAEKFAKLNASSFLDCNFLNCSFSEATLNDSKFCCCTFQNCNLSLVKISGCRFQEVLFQDSKIVGAEFFRCDRTFFSVSFKNCILQYCNFSDLNMKNVQILESRLKECYFTNTCLASSNFSESDLSGSLFHNCDLSKADFSDACNYSIDPQTNILKKAKFSLPGAVSLLNHFEISLS